MLGKGHLQGGTIGKVPKQNAEPNQKGCHTHMQVAPDIVIHFSASYGKEPQGDLKRESNSWETSF